MNTQAMLETGYALRRRPGLVGGLALLVCLFLLAPGAARAQSNACSADPATQHSGAHACTAAEAQSGIIYWGSNGLALTIPGAAGSAVTITRAVGSATDQHRSGIVIYNAGTETSSGADDGDISLVIGATGAVNIRQGASAQTYTGAAASNSGSGIVISPGTGMTATSSVTVDYRNGAIGTAAAPMQNDGILVNVWRATTVAHSITNAARIYAGKDGIELNANPGTGKVSVINSGDIDAARGIVVTNGATTNTGGSEIRNTGTVKATGAVGMLAEGEQPHGFYLYNGGTGPATVTNSGAVTSANAHGIFVNARWMAGAGNVTIVNSGAITAGKKGLWLQHGAPGTGAAAIRNNVGGTIAATAGHGIHLDTRSTGAASIDNKAAVTANGAGAHGIYLQTGTANTGTAAVTVENTAHIKANKDGIRLFHYQANNGRVSIANSGRIEADRGINAVTNANAGIGIENSGQIVANGAVGMLDEPDQPHGIYLVDSGTGSATEANPTIGNSGSVTSANAHGIFVNTEWKPNGGVRIENSGAIRAGRKGIWLIYGRAASARGAATIVNEEGGAVVAGTAAGATGAHGVHLRIQSSAGAASIDNKAAIAASGAGAHGVFLESWNTANSAAVSISNSGAIEANLDGVRLSNNGTGKATATNSGDIDADRGIALFNGNAMNTGGSEIVNSGVVMADGAVGALEEWDRPHGIYLSNGGAGAATIANSNAVTSDNADGVWLSQGGTGAATLRNSGAVTAGRHGLHVSVPGTNTGGVTIRNSAAVKAKTSGIYVWNGGAGPTRIFNAGAVTADGNFSRHGAGDLDSTGIRISDPGTDDLTIDNSADITANNYGVFARKEGTGGSVTVIHRSGDIVGKGNAGIAAIVGRWRDEGSVSAPAPANTADVRVDVRGGSVTATETHGKVAVAAENAEGGSAVVMIRRGATLTATHNVGVYAYLADRLNSAGRIWIEQAGTISAPGGVYATVARHNLEDETRAAAAQPVIDIDWTGTFSQEEGGAPLRPDSIAHGIEFAQEAQGEPVFGIDGDRPAIDAEVMSWRQVNRLVTAGDDPGEIADAAAQAALLAAGSGDAAVAARARTILDNFRAVLVSENLGAIPGADAIDADDNGTFSDAELTAYLTHDSAARRTELRDLLRRSLSAAEKAVLEALAAGRNADAALAAVPGASEDWKTEVQALARQFNDGNIDIDVSGGSIDAPGVGVRAWYALPHDGNGAIDVTIASGASVSAGAAGVYVANAGLDADGNRKQAVTVHGAVTGGTGAAVHLAGGGTVTVADKGRAEGDIRATAGALTFVSPEGGTVTGTVHDPAGPLTVNGTVGRILYSAGGTVTVGKTGRITGEAGSGEAIRSNAGALNVTVAGTVSGEILATGEGGALTLAVLEGGAVTGTLRDPAGPLTIGGTVGRILYSAGGAVTVTRTGRLTGVGGEAIRGGAGALRVTLAGAGDGPRGSLVEGDIRSGGTLTVADAEGEAGVPAGATVAGTIHNPASSAAKPFTVRGSVGRLLLGSGGTVEVAAGGAVTGVSGEADAIHGAAGNLAVDVKAKGAVTGNIRAEGDGNLDVKVSGSVAGGVFGLGGGEHNVHAMTGGAVSGRIHLETGAVTVDGTSGPVLLGRGGEVTVGADGRIARADGDANAIRSMAGNLAVDVKAKGAVTGDIRAEGDGNLDVKVSGSVAGGVFGLGGGEHNVHVMTGGAVSGRIHLEASAVTVDGMSGPVLLDRGGEVTVGSAGRIARADGGADAIRSMAGHLTVTVNGNVLGNIEGRGDGDMTFTVTKSVDGSVFARGGGTHEADIGADGAVTGLLEGFSAIVHGGKAGAFRLPAGGRISAAAGSEITGMEQDGMRVAIDAPEGALTADLNGTVGGAVLARDAGVASAVTVGGSGAVAGVVQLAGAGSAVAVDGKVRVVDVPRGGMVTIGENGRIEEGVREPRQGAVAVLVRAAPDESVEDAGGRVGGVAGGRGIEVKVRPSGASDSGADDVTLEIADAGALAVPSLAPVVVGAAVYEALPSVLLALNALPDHGEFLSSAGARRGIQARFHGGGGDRGLATPTGQDRRHDVRRYSFEAGVEGAIGENGAVAISVHHVRGKADIEGMEGGGVELSGTGARISGAWFSAGGYYVGGQAAATLYEADLNSADPKAERGELKHDISGRGYALGVEAGRRLDVRGVAIAPRIGASWSGVAMSSFTDSMGQRVSLDGGRSLKARAGLRAEAGGLFGTLDVERELSGRMDATVGDTRLRSEAESTWVRLGLGGAHEWNDGRFVLRGSANYAAARGGNRDFGGSASLTVRF